MKSKKAKAQAHGKDILEWRGGKVDFSSGCVVMGVLNVTPDSFSDGGRYLDAAKAVEHGLQMASDGAAIIDAGAESTRPGSAPVSAQEQIKRVTPVIKKLRDKAGVPISIDACKFEVVKAALEAGAGMINDITALGDERMGELAAVWQVPLVLMHMQGTPATMQTEPKYDDVVEANRSGPHETHLAAGEQILADLRDTSDHQNIGIDKTIRGDLPPAEHFDLPDGRKALGDKRNIRICNYLHPLRS